MELRDECSTIRLDDGVRNTFIAISGFCTEAKKNIWMRGFECHKKNLLEVQISNL